MRLFPAKITKIPVIVVNPGINNGGDDASAGQAASVLLNLINAGIASTSVNGKIEPFRFFYIFDLRKPVKDSISDCGTVKIA